MSQELGHQSRFILLHFCLAKLPCTRTDKISTFSNMKQLCGMNLVQLPSSHEHRITKRKGSQSSVLKVTGSSSS